ncbi:Uncharacterised protein [Moraxella lacunata]|uniref:Uncharacterized protein n=1 Tax=Moraxella lacunata TaxID=477 RepID=A0A378QK42_MORLA|nr:hypothetical protein [Moraxella lacunata]STY99683.1 Uncharacterised protein [Moraxella lacunata]
MKSDDELERIRLEIYETQTTISKDGRKIQAKAYHLYQFVYLSFAHGYEFHKNLDEPSAKRKLKKLEKMGYDEKYLQKWHEIYNKEHPPKKAG